MKALFHNILNQFQRRKVVLFIILLPPLFLPHTIIAQQEIRFERITVRDGLPDNTVSKVIQDYQGFLWLATQNGLVKYDGYEYKVYKYDPSDSCSMCGFSVYSIYEDRSKNLWIATDLGLSKYNRERELFENFSLDSSNYYIYSICEDDYGFLYFGSYHHGLGLYKFDAAKKTFIRFLHDAADINSIGSNFVRFLFREDSSTIWIGTEGGGLNKFDIKYQTFKRYKNIIGNHNSITSNNVYSIHKDRMGNLWIGTSRGLNRFNKQTESFTAFGIYSGDSINLEGYMISGVYEDKYGYLWLSVFNYGLVKFDISSGTFSSYSHKPRADYSLINNSVSCLLEDHSGVMWVGNTWGGLHKYDRQKSEFRYFEDLIQNTKIDHVYTIQEDSSGKFWLSTSAGIIRFERDSNKFVKFKKVLEDRINPEELITSYYDKHDQLWIGTSKGIKRFDNKKGYFSFYTHNVHDSNSISSNFINTFYEDRNGNLWIGTDVGMDVYNEKDNSFNSYLRFKDSSTIAGNKVNCIYEDKQGYLWIGTNLEGLFKLNVEKKQLKHLFYPEQGFICITAICEDKKGRFWTGTFDRGLSLIDRNSDSINYFTEKNGLIYNQTKRIIEDNSGMLWIWTDNGLSKFNPETKTFKNFDLNELHIEHSCIGIMKDRNGYLYFGLKDGFIMFHPDSLKENSIPPSIVLTDFKIFNESLKPSDNGPLKKNINVADEINLSYKDNIFSIEFATLDYHNPIKNQYAYMLEGFNKDWIYTDARNRTATYTNIDPGEYVFHVKGSNNDGIWNEHGASLKIIIKPPWWQTWWFRTAAVFILAGILGGSVRYVTIQRYKRRLALEIERSRISSDMHDEVGSSLSKISILSELAKHKAKDPELKGDVEKISESASEVVDNISEIIWAINPKNDTLDNLLAYIREYAAETLEMKNVDYKIELPDNVPHLAISAEARRNIFLVIKEALNNTVKYAQANFVKVTAEFRNSRLEFTVKDNGVGFDIMNTRMFGNGLTNMKKRMEDIDGEFSLDSKIGSGTEIRLSLNLS